jgi:hypothetical protein
VIPANASAPVSLLVSALGSFAGSVALSCSGLPLGASCQFQPSNVVNPVSGNPVSATLSVSTSSSTPLGASQITITASSSGGSDKAQTLVLTVGAAPDYSLAITNPSLTTHVNSSAIVNGTLTSINGYSNQVNLSCGAGAPPSCVVGPASVVPTTSGMPFTVTVSSAISQAYSFNVTGMGSDPSAITHSAGVNFTALPVQSFDFTLAATPPNVSVSAGKQSALYSLDVSPTTGTFPNSVSFDCSTMPALTTCVFNPAQVPSGNGDSVVTLTISTTAPVPRSAMIVASTFAIIFPIAGVFWLRQGRPPVKSRKQKRRIAITLVLFVSVLACVSCSGGLQGNGGGGSGSPGTPTGAYNITVTATSGTVTHSTQVGLTVTP